MKRSVAILGLVLALVAGACSGTTTSQEATPIAPVLVNGNLPRFDEPVRLKVMTHDSFAVSQSVLDEFTSATNVTVELVPSGDAVTMTNAAILTAGNPVADVIFGFDENLLNSVLTNSLLEKFQPERRDRIDAQFLVDSSGFATPIDYGDVCVNFDRVDLGNSGISIPTTFEGLADPSLKNELVVGDPSTSTPGLAFLLATIAKFGGGDDSSSDAPWLRYWKQLKENGVSVVDGWETAYYGSFSGGSGKGDRALVVSYASSPPAEVSDVSIAIDETPTGVIVDTCYRQTEFAGVLRGAAHPEAAAAFIEFMLGDSFQADVPGQMYVYPVVRGTPLPPAFEKYTAPVAQPLSLPFGDVASNRDRWISQWSTLFR